MLRLFACCGTALLAACSPIMDDDVRTVARAAAEARYAAECGGIEVPARAFLPVDLTGDKRGDYMLSFARVLCEKNLNLWSGAGGPLFQLWTDEGGKPRMLLEQNMHAFRHDLRSADLVTDQYGANCPGGAAPQICRVVYRWDKEVHDLRVIDRAPLRSEPLSKSGDVSMWLQPSTQGKASPAAETTIYRQLSIRTDPHTHN